MTMKVNHSVFDGTTGGGAHGGRRTHIIRLLRDTKEPLTVAQVAQQVNLPPNVTRYHLESLVDAGLATREVQNRATPGRPKVAYLGTLPDQTHEREQGYRLLAEILAMTVARANADAGEWMYHVGQDWGRYLTDPSAEGPIDETQIMKRLMEKLDALWFAPELSKDDPPRVVLHNCPFADSTQRYPQVVCQLHAGLINGSLAEMKSGYRLTRLNRQNGCHKCEGELSKTTRRMDKVPLDPPTSLKPTPATS
jgi:predicted ArsR family transcriptional regulator